MKQQFILVPLFFLAQMKFTLLYYSLILNVMFLNRLRVLDMFEYMSKFIDACFLVERGGTGHIFDARH
jgi:hypothetical protein